MGGLRGWKSAVLAVCVLVGAVAGCSDGGDSGDGAGGTFSLEHAWGQTDFPSSPQRVVVSGSGIDAALAFNLPIVAAGNAAGNGLAPWQSSLKDKAVDIVGSDRSINFEAIAQADPDLIIMSPFEVHDQQTYDRLAGIAPTLAGIIPATEPVPADGGVLESWTDQVTGLGKILGREQDAERIIADDAKLVTDLRERLPGLAGKSAVIAQYIGPQKTFNLVADQEDPANQFFVELGMSLPQAILSNPDFHGRAAVSLELLPSLAADFMAIFPYGATAAELEALPGYRDLPQVRGNTTAVMDYFSIVALNVPSALSRAQVLDQIRPLLERIAAS